MNASSYKTVFSKRLGALVAVGEHATSQGKANGASGPGASGASEGAASALAGIGYVAALSASFAFVSIAWAAPATTALPTGGTVVHGTASMSQNASQLNITQGSQRAAINWQSFDIGANAKVNVVQPNAQAVLLNRVVGQSPSQIFGQLQANGHVILVNPNGVLFGKDGSVNAGGFTASTLNISDANFMAGNMVYERNGSTAGIVNQGSITAAPGGYVALLGATVSNEGSITTKGGSVVMGAGETIKVPVSGTGRIKLELTPAAINASLSNTGSIVTEGGQVYMQALALNRAAAQILQSGSIDTTGEKGGDVHVLADGGHIRVDGRIKANSNNGTAGGDIIIGRDEVTGVLAKTTDVSNAKLESNKGFVETSGDWLATDGVSVKASEWLLDPSDITISSATSSNVTGTSPADITPDGGAGTSSIVQVSTIQNSINVGTNVTIKTTNSSNATGAGNIIIADKLTFTNTGATDATLSLIADNGITQNAVATITTTTASTKLVNIKMEAKGDYQGNTVESTNSKGITLNSTITTNGTVILTGTSKDTSGVQLTKTVPIKNAAGVIVGYDYNYGVTNNGRSGVVFNGGSGITADNFQVTGMHTVTAGNSFGVNGVYMNGAVTFKATGNTDSNITGNSNAQGNFGAGLMVWDGAKVTLENQGTGVTTLKGSNTNTGGGNGVRIGAMNNSAVINAIGRVTLGQQTANVNAPIFIRSTINAIQNNATQSGLRIVGQTEKNTSAVQIWDTNINATGIDVVVDGITANAAGVYIQNSNYTTWTTKNLRVTGVANTTLGSSGSGVVVQRYAPVLTVNASGNIDIEGTVQGAGNGRGLYFAESGWGAQAPILTADGNITLRGNNRAATSNTSAALQISSGLLAQTTTGNIVLQGETNNTTGAVNAINITSQMGVRPITNSGVTTYVPTPLSGNTSLQSGGNVLIQSNQGGINFSPANVYGSVSSSVSENKITGVNITIDNTGAGMTVNGVANANGGRIDASTGAIAAGSGKATGTGISMTDTRVITATGNLNIAGASTIGVGINTNGVLTAKGDVNLTGTSAGTAVAVYSTGAIESTEGGVSIKGTNTNTTAAGGGGTTIQGTVTAKKDIKLEGYSSNTNTALAPNPAGNQGLVIQNVVTSSDGNITVKGETKAKNQKAVAITQLSGTTFGSLITSGTNKTININADTLYINEGTGGVGASVNAGSTGTVSIKTFNPNKEILVGIADDLVNQKLGIENAELNRITAGKLVIGDASAGKITVSAATTTLANTGHVTLQTSGNIEVNAGLKVGDDGTGTATKNLTLNGAGASSSITQTAAIKAASLELLGTNATHTLTNTGNQVTTLAGNSKAINYVNGSALTLGAVNATPGVNATGDVSIATQTGNLTITENVSTTATTATALVLNAGKSSAVGAAVGADTGGNILVSTGKTVSVGSGGTAQLMTGSITGDTSAAGLAAAGNFRYNSDETNTNYNTALSSGVNVIYREKPTLTVNVNNASKTYDGLTFTGGNGFTEVTPSGLKNGDGLTGATATAVYGGTAQNAKNVSSTPYTLSASESITGKSALGYRVTYNSGTLTVGKADLSVALADQTKTYDGTTAATLAPAAFTVKGVTVAGQTETASVNQTVAFYNDKNVLGASSVTANLAAGNFAAATGTDLNNYNLPTSVTGKGTITPRPLTIAPGSVATKTADGTTVAVVTPGALSNLVGNETLGVAATGTFSDANAGNNKAVNAFYTLQNGANGGLASNYILALGKPGNPDTRMTGTILAAVNPVTPIAPVNNNTGSVSRVRTVSGFGGAGAATGVLDDKAVTESREVCSDVFPENCECQPSVIPSIEICFAPKSVAATKEEK